MRYLCTGCGRDGLHFIPLDREPCDGCAIRPIELDRIRVVTVYVENHTWLTFTHTVLQGAVGTLRCRVPLAYRRLRIRATWWLPAVRWRAGSTIQAEVVVSER